MTPSDQTVKTNLANIDVFLRMTGTTLTDEQLMFIGDTIKGLMLDHDINHQIAKLTRAEMGNLN